jgi:hypothetical protein
MLWMNESEVKWAEQKHAGHPVLGPATKLLSAMVDLANSKSDGWCYWPTTGNACVKLMEMIQDHPLNATPARLKAAITPIRAFCTRHKFTFPGEEKKTPTVVKLSVQLCQNNLSDGSKTYDVLIHEREFGDQDDMGSPMTRATTIQVSPPNRQDAEKLIDTLGRLGGAERDPDTERSY